MPNKKCEELVKQEKYTELLTYCSERLDLGLPKEEYLFYQAVALTALKNFSKAENIFTNLFNKTKKYFYLICRGLTRFVAGNFEGGKKDFAEAIYNDESYNDMIFVFRITSSYYDLEDAKEALEKAMELNKKESLDELGKMFEGLSENVKIEDRLMFVRIMELLKVI